MCEKEQLLSSISTVSRLATTRATLPILQNIYIEAIDGKVILRSTDLEQTVEITVPAEVTEPGRLTIPARMILEYLTNNGDHSLTLETDDVTLIVTSTNHRATLKGLPAEEYPTLPAVKSSEETTFPAHILTQTLNQVLFAAAVDDTRPVLGGVLWRFSRGSLELVATDGYRLSYAKLPNTSKITGDFIIPRRAILELVRFTNVESITLSLGGTQASFHAGRTTLISRILEGKFPDFVGILPKKSAVVTEIAATAFARSLKLASLFSRDSAYSTKISLEGTKLIIEATSVQLGENRNEVTLEKAVDQPVSVSANAQYLIEALGHMNGTASFELTDNKSPIVLRPTSGDAEVLYLVMPLRSE